MFNIELNGLRIRPLLYDDLPYVKKIRDECLEFIHNNKSISLKDSQTWYLDNYPPYLVIEKESIIIGYFRISNLKRHSCYVGLDLMANQRGKGFGFKIYSILIQKLIKIGITDIKLKVLNNNDVALNLYLKLGFEQIEQDVSNNDFLLGLNIQNFKSIIKN